MLEKNKVKVLNKIKFCVLIIIIGLIISGITAFPIQTELKELSKLDLGFLNAWIKTVYQSVRSTNVAYPWLAYGTDWFAFAHILLAILFYGPLKNPVKNVWVIDFGIISCIGIIPLALIAESIREIPFYWQLVDCSFGLLAIIPLLYVKRLIGLLLKPTKSC
ncbi:hypothetical protein ABIB40_001673 [Pedobacter sp. UYP30]|uniref:hypothetical protein n=1 Tax=Pedobacter sp. UYP30 TaxID=1756400 RepID=UPI0033988575